MCQITLEEAGMPRHRKPLVQYDVKALKHASKYIAEAQRLAGKGGDVPRSLAQVALSITRPCAAIGAALEALSEATGDATRALVRLQELTQDVEEQ